MTVVSRPGRAIALLGALALLLTLVAAPSASQAQSDEVLRSGETASDGLQLIANLPKTGPFAGTSAYNSDIAFQGKYAIQGNYEGVQITDISRPHKPEVVVQAVCPGSQNDVSVYGDLLITSTDSPRTDDSCNSSAQPASNRSDPNTWEGIRVWDWSDPKNPEVVANVRTFCGSHTHTILPEPENNRLLVYVSSYDVQSNYWNCSNPWTNLSVVEVPLDDPASSSVIGEPNPWEGTEFDPNPGTTRDPSWPAAGFPGTRTTNGCHDVTAYKEIGLIAGACTGEGVLMDIATDSENPKVTSRVIDPNFAFWHSATFSHDGSSVLFTDELGGGGMATCVSAIPDSNGANAIFTIEDGDLEFASYWKLPREQSTTENCVAHNGSLLPLKDRTVMVQAWYQGGISLLDWTDPHNPTELAWFDRGPLDEETLILGGSWSAYYYNGHIYSNDIQLGLDVLRIHPSKLNPGDQGELNRFKWDEFNAQFQEPLSAGSGPGKGPKN